MNKFSFNPASAASTGDALDFLHTMKGPDFLCLFLLWFLATILTVVFLRKRGRDSVAITIAGFICFESLGVARIAVGSAHGLHNWSFLILMMIVCALFFVLRAKYFEGMAGAGGSSCSGSGCGGGGGCGGGCGGCGGS